MKYVKRSSIVDAWETTDLINRYATTGHEGLPEPVADAYENGQLDFSTGLLGDRRPERIDVFTQLGMQQAPHGWWLVHENHQFYPVRPDTFAASYKPLIGGYNDLTKKHH